MKSRPRAGTRISVGRLAMNTLVTHSAVRISEIKFDKGKNCCFLKVDMRIEQSEHKLLNSWNLYATIINENLKCNVTYES